MNWLKNELNKRLESAIHICEDYVIFVSRHGGQNCRSCQASTLNADFGDSVSFFSRLNVNFSKHN